jgi:arylformamidase
MPIWPDSTGFHLSRTQKLEDGSPSNVSRLDCDVHAGTHVDAPRHLLENGATAEQLPLEILIGPTTVAYLPHADAITADDLAALNLPAGTERLLLRTRNSELWAAGASEFCKDYAALTADAARWLVERGIRLIGVDYLSVQRYGDSPLTHQLLLEAGIVLLEGLNLAGIAPGEYELICLPLNLVGAEAAPARAVLRQLSLSPKQTGGQA